jgi:hypothetical protein
MTDTTCPACGRTFRSLKGRSGHLATFNDGTHASYRQAHGMKAPLGPNHQPTKAGTRVRGAKVQPPTSAASPGAPFAVPAAPAAQPADHAGDFKRALRDLTEKSLEANRARAEREAVERAWQTPTAPPRAPPAPVAPNAPPASAPTAPQTQAAQPADSPPKSPADDWLIAGGAALTGLGLAALVKNLKGANAPTEATEPQPPAGRPNMQLPSGIWATPEVQPETTGNPWLDSQLGYSGGIRTRRHGL